MALHDYLFKGDRKLSKSGKLFLRSTIGCDVIAIAGFASYFWEEMRFGNALVTENKERKVVKEVGIFRRKH